MTEIVTLIKQKDERGLSMLYDKYAPALLGVITHIVHNQSIGEEILQQSFLKIWQNIQLFNDQKGTFFTWMATIARNTAIDHARLKSTQNQSLTDEMSALSKEPSTTMPLDNIDVKNLLAKLDIHHRQVLDLLYLKGYTQRAAADVLDIPLGTVKTRLRLAILALREELKSEKKLFFGSLILFILILLYV